MHVLTVYLSDKWELTKICLRCFKVLRFHGKLWTPSVRTLQLCHSVILNVSLNNAMIATLILSWQIDRPKSPRNKLELIKNEGWCRPVYRLLSNSVLFMHSLFMYSLHI